MKSKATNYQTSATVEDRRASYPMLTTFLDESLRPNWTAAEADEDFVDFVGVVNQAGLRQLVQEVAVLPEDNAEATHLLASLVGASDRRVLVGVGQDLAESIRDVTNMTAHELAADGQAGLLAA